MKMEVFGVEVKAEEYEVKMAEIKKAWEEEDAEFYEGIYSFEEYAEDKLHAWVWKDC